MLAEHFLLLTNYTRISNLPKDRKYKMRGLLINMGLQASPVAGRLRIGYLLLMIIGTGLTLCNVSADNHETQQLVTITGIVVDSNTEVPLPDVTIRVTDTQIRVTTDETGAFSLELPIGTYKIQASASFYNTFVVTDFQIKAGGTPEPLRVLLVAASGEVGCD